MGYCPCFGSRKEKKFKGNKDATDLKRQHIPSTIFNLPTFSPVPEVESSVTDSNYNAQTFTFRELATATKNFREDSLLGQGGFGAVYKGRLEKTGQVVAVKQLDKSGFQGEKEFLVEVLMLSLLRHPNLVNLIGYCAEGDQRLLVYEYMPFGCLADHLHDYTSGRETLDWNTRMKIAAGAAKGLEYLHHEAKPPVIYRDVKSANILLGEGFYPKLSDFGLAKFGPSGDKSHVSTRVMGTQGYCAPEYAKTGKLTAKSDIYSFGVVLLELITGRQVLDDNFGRDKRLVEWAFKMLRASDTDITILADPQLKGRFKKSMLRKALEVAFMCLKDDASARPSMSEVAEAFDYLKSRQYDPSKAFINSVDDHKKCVDFGNESPKETTRMLNKNNSERERAVAEARLWGETWREKRRQSAPTISDKFNNL